MKAAWLIDGFLVDREYGDSIVDALNHYGYETHIQEYNLTLPAIVPNNYTQDRPVVLYGPHQFIKKLRSSFNPGAFCNEHNLRFSVFSANLPQDCMLNRLDVVKYLPFSHVKMFEEYRFAPFFLRPDVVTKTFAGHIVYEALDISTLEQCTSVSDDTWCVVAPERSIIAEFRYVIVNGKVITGSQYRRDNVLDVRIDTMPGADKLAQAIAEYEWQADTVYVCDIAETPYGFKVIELNSFSCAGLYACDKRKIALAVSEAAELEFYDV